MNNFAKKSEFLEESLEWRNLFLRYRIQIEKVFKGETKEKALAWLQEKEEKNMEILKKLYEQG